MIKIAMSPAASALLRAMIARAAVPRDRILLVDVQSVDWRSLVFTGERHILQLRVQGADSDSVVERMCDRLEEAEFSIPGLFVADITVANAPKRAADGSTTVSIEALTISED